MRSRHQIPLSCSLVAVMPRQTLAHFGPTSPQILDSQPGRQAGATIP